jgi:hypothetical protein
VVSRSVGFNFWLCVVCVVFDSILDRWQTLEEISNAQGDCMRRCILEKTRPESGCLTELGGTGYWYVCFVLHLYLYMYGLEWNGMESLWTVLMSVQCSGMSCVSFLTFDCAFFFFFFFCLMINRACALVNPDTMSRTPCKNRLRWIEVSSADCTCVRTSGGDCINAYEIMYDVWGMVPDKYRNEARLRPQQ